MNYARLKQIFLNSFDEDNSDDLFRVLPSKEIAPAQWDKQIKFWSEIITRWADDSQIVEAKVGDIVQNLTWNDVIPPIFPTISFLISTKVCKTPDDYKKRSGLGRLAHSFMKIVTNTEITNETRLIFQNNLRLLCKNIREKVLARASMLSDVVLTESGLSELCNGADINIVTEFMLREKIAEKIGNGYFFDDNSQGSSTREVVLAMHNSKALLEKLDKMAKDVEKNVVYYSDYAKKMEHSGRHKDALTATRRYMLEKDKYDKTTSLRSKIECSIFDLNKAAINATIIKGMQAINKIAKSKISIDNIDEIVDEYQETVDSINEISDTIGRPAAGEIDDADLEKELNDLCMGQSIPMKPYTSPTGEEPITYTKIGPRRTQEKPRTPAFA